MATPRTPADIGRDIAAAQQRIVDLKAELAGVPPETLEIRSASHSATITVKRYSDHASLDLVARRDGRTETSGFYFQRDAKALRDWLNYYYPEA